jgi:tetratricopeptide (TPR) repeat protein
LTKPADRPVPDLGQFSCSVEFLCGRTDFQSVPHGRLQTLRGRYTKAAAEYARVIEAVPLPTAIAPHDVAFAYACLLCLTGDDAGYQRLCRRLVERAGPKPTPALAFVLARSCALAHEGAVDPAQSVTWAEQAVREWPKTAWYVHALGLAHLRAGEWQQARQHFEESDAAGWGNATVLNWLGLALVHCQLGNADEARGWLRKAATWLDQAAPTSLPETDWLEAQVLRREAERNGVMGGGKCDHSSAEDFRASKCFGPHGPTPTSTLDVRSAKGLFYCPL